MFQFRRFPAYDYLIHRTLSRYCRDGFPHSDISGSSLICSSPKLFAACRVLHRLLMPRHSPCALSSLTSSNCDRFAGAQFESSPLTSCFSELCRLHKGFFEIVSTLIYLKFHIFFLQLLRCALCCLAFLHLFLCSVFKVQKEGSRRSVADASARHCVPSKLNNVRLSFITTPEKV